MYYTSRLKISHTFKNKDLKKTSLLTWIYRQALELSYFTFVFNIASSFSKGPFRRDTICISNIVYNAYIARILLCTASKLFKRCDPTSVSHQPLRGTDGAFSGPKITHSDRSSGAVLSLWRLAWHCSHSSASTADTLTPFPHSRCWPPPLGTPAGPHHLHLTLSLHLILPVVQRPSAFHLSRKRWTN